MAPIRATEHESSGSLHRFPIDSAIYAVFDGQVAWADIMMPTITPNNPRALPKISITKIFTNREEF